MSYNYVNSFDMSRARMPEELASDHEPYGLGTTIEGDGEHTLFGHIGGIGGYQNFAYYLEPEGAAVIVMSNRVPTDLRAASSHILAAVLGIPYP